MTGKPVRNRFLFLDVPEYSFPPCGERLKDRKHASQPWDINKKNCWQDFEHHLWESVLFRPELCNIFSSASLKTLLMTFLLSFQLTLCCLCKRCWPHMEVSLRTCHLMKQARKPHGQGERKISHAVSVAKHLLWAETVLGMSMQFI